MTEKQLLEMLHSTYNTYLLNRQQTAQALGISTATLDRMKKDGLGPAYKKDQRSKNGAVKYTLNSITDYILANNIKTI